MIWRIRRIRMITLITNSGRKIICEGVMKGRQFDVLHIYTHAITPIEAYSIFENPDEYSEPLNICRKTTEVELHSVLSNSFGFGGTNSALVIKKITNL